MGADFTFAFFDTSIKQADLVEYIKTMPENLLAEIADDQFAMFPNEYETEQEFYETTRSNIIGFVEEAYTSRNSREVSVMLVDGKEYLITGGMSWGDDPTDHFRAFCITAEIQAHYLDK